MYLCCKVQRVSIGDSQCLFKKIRSPLKPICHYSLLYFIHAIHATCDGTFRWRSNEPKKPKRLSQLMERWMKRSGTQHSRESSPLQDIVVDPRDPKHAQEWYQIISVAAQVATQMTAVSVSVVANLMATTTFWHAGQPYGMTTTSILRSTLPTIPTMHTPTISPLGTGISTGYGCSSTPNTMPLFLIFRTMSLKQNTSLITAPMKLMTTIGYLRRNH